MRTVRNEVLRYDLPLIRGSHAVALYKDPTASRADVLQAVSILEDVTRARRKAYGTHHPRTLEARIELDRAQMTLDDVAAP